MILEDFRKVEVYRMFCIEKKISLNEHELKRLDCERKEMKNYLKILSDLKQTKIEFELEQKIEECSEILERLGNLRP